MKRIGFALFPVLGLVLAASFSLGLVQHPPEAEENGATAAPFEVILGRDSPNLGGNTFRDAFISLTVGSDQGLGATKVVNEISFPDNGEVDFERAELTPDVASAGGKLSLERLEPAGGMKRIRLTIDSPSTALPNGIVANLVFKVIKEFSLDEIGTEEYLVVLDNTVSAWGADGEEIAELGADPGSIDLAYAPVVFACFFYMH